ncbi:ABC transporter ATP-binding protein [Paenibacillus koleovorans]|uniref:ABC transporter ATP-binding protein n=1 Tax=Paenibacillus koleovorans TaxID=121608 RepID=UPI000FDBAA18|nr:ABC transporter ATP-binding protein [Paenibacillus koleovorans]
MATVLAVRGVTKRIGGRTIVDNISFDVQEGEIFGLLGPNGAGKTTTIRMIVGLAKPSEGSIAVCGHDVHTDHRNAMRQIGTIVENPELYPYLSGLENLRQFARLSGPVDAAKIDSIVKLVGLEERIRDKVRRYSLGMRQRLGVAQALLSDPKLLILDEPTNGLDPAGIREFRELLQSLARQGISILISSHLLSEIELVCTRVGVIHRGKWITTASVSAMKEEAAGTDSVLIHVSSAEAAIAALIAAGAKGLKFHEVSATTIAVDGIGHSLNPVLRPLLDEGIAIMRIEERRSNLEDIFLEITGGALHG